MAPKQTTTVVGETSFIPLELGNYTVRATLTNPANTAIFDVYTNVYPVAGTHAVSLDVQPAFTKTTAGLSFPFVVNLLNTGDFSENIQLTWRLLDPQGEEYLASTSNVPMEIGETKSLSYSPFIQLGVPLGTHTLVVEMVVGNTSQTRRVSFSVVSPSDYYAQLITDLELRTNQLDDKIDDLQQRGFDVGEVRLLLLDIQTELARAKGMLLSGKYDELSPVLLDLSARITKLSTMIDALQHQSPLLSREGLNLLLYAGSALLLGLFLWLLYWILTREKKEKKTMVIVHAGPKWLSSTLRVDKCYYSIDERTKIKRKPLIGKLVGIIEGEEEWWRPK